METSAQNPQPKPSRGPLLALIVVLPLLALAIAYSWQSLQGTQNDYHIDPRSIVFKDEVANNSEPPASITSLKFVDREGLEHPLSGYIGKRPLIFVMTRGYGGAICPYCTAQVSSLIANYDTLQEHGADVLVVYPVAQAGDASHFDELLARATRPLSASQSKVPFPVLYDVALKGVDALGLRQDLSKPATYVFDAAGQLRFAYVGSNLADRPSIKALVTQLDKLKS